MDKKQLLIQAIHTRTDNCLVDDINIINDNPTSDGLSTAPSLDDLDLYEESITRSQWFAYTLDRDILSALVDDVKAKGLDVLRASSSFNIDKDELVRYCREELSDVYSDADIISKITPYDDGAYTRVPGYLNVLSCLVLRQGYLDLWLDLLNSLKYFPIQGVLLYRLHTVKECKQVITSLDIMESFGRKQVVLYLLRDRMFEIMIKEHDYLQSNSKNETLPDDVRQMAEEELSKWQESIDERIEEMISVFYKYFSAQQMCEWYVSKLAHAKRKAEKYAQMDFYALNKIEPHIARNLDIRKIDFESSTLEALTYYAKKVTEGLDAEKVLLGFLLVNITKRIYTEKSFTTPNLNDATLENMRCIYECIIKEGGDWLHVSAEYEPKEVSDTEQYYSSLFRSQIGDSYWLSILLLMCEKTEDIEYFKKVCERLYSVCKCDQSTLDSLFLPAYLGEVLVVQIFKDLKDEYEATLIETIKRISLLMRILSANDGEMSAKVAMRLIDRNTEWNKERERMNTYNKNLVEYLDKYMNNVQKRYGKQE